MTFAKLFVTFKKSFMTKLAWIVIIYCQLNVLLHTTVTRLFSNFRMQFI